MKNWLQQYSHVNMADFRIIAISWGIKLVIAAILLII